MRHRSRHHSRTSEWHGQKSKTWRKKQRGSGPRVSIRGASQPGISRVYTARLLNRAAMETEQALNLNFNLTRDPALPKPSKDSTIGSHARIPRLRSANPGTNSNVTRFRRSNHSDAQALDLHCRRLLSLPKTVAREYRNPLLRNALSSFASDKEDLRTEGAFWLAFMVDSQRQSQSHTEPPSGRISVFEKGRLVGSFESWRQAVQFIRAHHLRRATLVPESQVTTIPKRSSPTIGPGA